MRRISTNLSHDLGCYDLREAAEGKTALPMLTLTAAAKRKQAIEAAQAGVSAGVLKLCVAQRLEARLDKIFGAKAAA